MIYLLIYRHNGSWRQLRAAASGLKALALELIGSKLVDMFLNSEFRRTPKQLTQFKEK